MWVISLLESQDGKEARPSGGWTQSTMILECDWEQIHIVCFTSVPKVNQIIDGSIIFVTQNVKQWQTRVLRWSTHVWVKDVKMCYRDYQSVLATRKPLIAMLIDGWSVAAVVMKWDKWWKRMFVSISAYLRCPWSYFYFIVPIIDFSRNHST